MKIIFTIITLIFSVLSSAQVTLGKAAVTNSSVSLEFGNYVAGQGKGIIVPWVTSAASVANAVNGTIIYDTSDHIMKYLKGGSWFNLSKNETVTIAGSSVDTTGTANTSLQDNLTDLSNAKVSIGTVTSIPGILVLEDNNKAMVLPLVPSPHLNIVNPEPGTMVFDTVTKQLCIFNGKVWSFWKP